ncbi:MAG TPA: hypothetical protein VGM23_05100 [Armatimonadota bacterium]|jgi:hypothetical protein
MFIIAKVLILVGLFRLLSETDKPFVCSGLYGAAVLLLGLAAGSSASALLLSTLIALAVSSLYFWALSKLDGTLFWWPVMIVGLAMIMF